MNANLPGYNHISDDGMDENYGFTLVVPPQQLITSISNGGIKIRVKPVEELCKILTSLSIKHTERLASAGTWSSFSYRSYCMTYS